MKIITGFILEPQTQTSEDTAQALGTLWTEYNRDLYDSHMGVLISDYKRFFFFSLYLKQKFFFRELISTHSPKQNSKAVFLFKEVSGFTHSNGRLKYSFCLHFGAIQNIEVLYMQRWSPALSLRPLNYTSPKELMGTKFWYICPIILRSGVLVININYNWIIWEYCGTPGILNCI